MTKILENYVKGRIEEGTLCAKELQHQLDFSEKRDQEALFQILGYGMVRNDEISLLDELHKIGFDFSMRFERGETLTEFFSKFPKFDVKHIVYKKIESYSGLSVVDKIVAKELLKILMENQRRYHFWWEPESEFDIFSEQEITKELDKMVLKLAKKISAESAETMDEVGISVLHYLVWHIIKM